MDDQILISIIAVFAIFALIVILTAIFQRHRPELPEERAGRLGEQFATTLIREILTPEDILLTNVHLFAEGKETELDNIIVNSHGIFIIEVKNYNGELWGDEEDYEWIKNKISGGGMLYQTNVKNPIRQVKRQVYILSRVLKERNIEAWINGYVFLTERNSPVKSSMILESQADMDRAIHSGKDILPDRVIERIVSVLITP